MFCDCGGRKSSVVNTRNHENAVRRQRKCASCNKNFFTVEIKELVSNLAPQPDERGLYTPEAAVSLKMSKTLTRRKNEDRVASYYIEDDYDH
jgi:transcriptional regulator NrdR family protein